LILAANQLARAVYLNFELGFRLGRRLGLGDLYRLGFGFLSRRSFSRRLIHRSVLCGRSLLRRHLLRRRSVTKGALKRGFDGLLTDRLSHLTSGQ